MKSFLFVIAATLLLSGLALSQKVETAIPAAAVAPPASVSPAAPAASPGAPAKPVAFPRERFDPTRDARADLDAAMKSAAASGKNIVLDVGGEWCPWCVFMDKFFYMNPDIDKLREANYVWVKVNFSKENENKEFLSAYPEAAGYPHLYVLDPSGKLLQSQDTSELEMGKGYNPEKFVEFLNKWSPKPGVVDSAKSAVSPK